MKLFFSDLDGTLLNDRKKITPATRAALDAWAARGHRLVLCSGRPLQSIQEVRKELELTYSGMYLIGFNGCLIYECDSEQIVYRASLPLAQVAHIMAEAEHFGIYCHTYDADSILTPADGIELTFYRQHIHLPYRVISDLSAAALDGRLTCRPCKCLAIEPNADGRLEEFRTRLLPYAKEHGICLVYSNDYLLEIFPEERLGGVSGKGASVHRLCRLLSVPASQSVAAGDQGNDISMLQAAGVGIGMLNGTDSVKKAATIVTAHDNNHDGLAEALLSLL